MKIHFSSRVSRSVLRASVLCAIFAPNTADAAHYFVSPDGDDANPGTESLPFLTIRHGVDAASNPGDTLWLRGGVYEATDTWENQLNFQYSGEPGNPITFAAYPGELPILDGAALREDGASAVEIVEPATGPVSHIRIIGIVARNWGTSGFSNGWHESEPLLSSSDISYIHCIADNNGVNGFSFTGGENLYMEGNIAVHNGNMLPSWSSGVSLLEAHGDNQIIGNVSFENIDISTGGTTNSGVPTDGSGFILDENTTHANVANNIAFRNGGSCLRVTKSSNINLINNTCFQNGQDSRADYNQELVFSDSTSANGSAIRNTAGIAGPEGQWHPSLPRPGTDQNNVWTTGSGGFVSTSGALDFHIRPDASTLIDVGFSSNAPSTDIGFDPLCIRPAQNRGADWPSWWQYEVDYDYVASVGGVAGCFNPGMRPAGGGMDIGAYELDATPVGCMTDDECADDSPCTTDICAPGHKCTYLPVENCCVGDGDCDDGDECTIDACNTAEMQCAREIDTQCGQDLSGELAYNDSGYAAVCNWGGFMWTAAGPEDGPGLNDSMSAIEDLGDLCYSGNVAAYDDYSGYAMLGLNINQDNNANTDAENLTLGGAGINVAIENKKHSLIRIQLQDAPDDAGEMNTWCIELDGVGGFFPWTDFNTECWNTEGENAQFYAGEPVNVVAVMVAGHNVKDRAFEFCLRQLSPSAEECSDPAELCPNETQCDNACIDTRNDEANCGGCGTACAEGETCNNGSCASDSGCGAGLMECGGDCVNLDSSADHCGECNNACDDDLLCSNGECSDSCDDGLTVCDQACADLDEDAEHCGECGNACDDDERCDGGECVGEGGGSGDSEGDEGSSEDDDGEGGGDSAGAAGDGTLTGCACNTSRGGSSQGLLASVGLVLLGIGARRRRRRVVS